MKKGKWTFITNHGKLLAHLTKHPKATNQRMAFDTGLSIRAITNIIVDLRQGGYLSWVKEGRRNSYTVHLDQPMRCGLEKGYRVGDVLAAIGCHRHERKSERYWFCETEKEEGSSSL